MIDGAAADIGASAAVWLALALAAPWVAWALFGALGRSRAIALALPVAAAPALVAGLFVSAEVSVSVDLLLWGAEFGPDSTNRAFLVGGAIVWIGAGAYAAGSISSRELSRFSSFWLAAMGGSLALALSRDLASFYAGFAVMTFAAYGLVVHTESPAALRAGRFYVAVMLVGEVCVLAAVALAAAGAEGAASFDVADAAHPGAAFALFSLGFGIKLGALGLHSWLPRAHPVAPAAASAILSGAMVKAGALGALRVYEHAEPLGPAAWGGALCALGAAGALYGAARGIAETEAKRLLAWSTVSQMGLVVAALGALLAAPDSWPVARATVGLFALHHGLAKAALFTGAALVATSLGRARWAILAALAIPALALAGAPLTTGSLAKSGLEQAAALTPYEAWLAPALTAASAATAALMLRFFHLLWNAPGQGGSKPPPPLWAGWMGLVATLGLARFVPLELALGEAPPFGRKSPASALWPVVAGAVAYALGAGWLARRDRTRPNRAREDAGSTSARARARRWRARALYAERFLQRWPVIGYLLLALLAILALALWP